MKPADAEAWLRLRSALWPDDDHADDVRRFLAGELCEPLAVLIAEEGSHAIGFIELSIRAYAEGCETDRVAFVEGWYVAPETRRTGVGRALIAAAEDWARTQGCRELASDAEADNRVGIDAHRALGFEDAGLIRCFRKDL